MKLHNALTATVLSVCLAGPMTATTRHHHYTRSGNDTQVVDVNAHAVPPGPPDARHVIVVNSAQHAPRRHGLAGAFQRLHKWHMRQRAAIYRGVTK